MGDDYQQLRPVPGAEDEEEEESTCSPKARMGFAVVILLVVGGVYTGMTHKQELGVLWDDFLWWCETLGWKAGVLIAIITWLATSVGLPASAFFIGSGVVFANLYGATVGAMVAILSCGTGFWAGCLTAFVLGRHILKPMIQRKLDSLEAVRAINIIIAEEGWMFAFLIRLSPFMPVEVFNFACAMTDLSFQQNALACLGSVPVASFEIWMAAQVTDAAIKGRSEGDEGASDTGHGHLGIMIAANVFIIILLIFVVHHANKKYQQKVDESRAAEQKIVLKNRRELQRTLSRVSTTVTAARAIGAHQAYKLTVKSIHRSTTTFRGSEFAVNSWPPGASKAWTGKQTSSKF